MQRRTRYAVVAGIVVVVLPLAGWGGLHVKKAAAQDPAFCLSCHQMDGPYERWEQSAHREVTCVKCHPGSLASDLRHGWLGLVMRQTAVESRAEVDQGACQACHVDAGEGDWPHVAATAGHALHVGQKSIPCVDCHAGSLHVVRPGSDLCQDCHERELQIAGMSGRVHCLQCHPFLTETEPLVADAATCRGCHTEDADWPHASVDCLTCHAPHAEEQPGGTCAACHEQRAPGHPASVRCDGCHTPHTEATAGAGRCGECHTRSSHGGHVVCVDCHDSHEGTAPPTCASCHPTRKGLHLLSGHAACASCHGTHRLSPAGPDQCRACHEEVFREHASTGCPGCHRFDGR